MILEWVSVIFAFNYVLYVQGKYMLFYVEITIVEYVSQCYFIFFILDFYFGILFR